AGEAAITDDDVDALAVHTGHVLGHLDRHVLAVEERVAAAASGRLRVDAMEIEGAAGEKAASARPRKGRAHKRGPLRPHRQEKVTPGGPLDVDAGDLDVVAHIDHWTCTHDGDGRVVEEGQADKGGNYRADHAPDHG